MAMRRNVTEPILNVYDEIAAAPQPVVCAVQGLAHGFGCAIATACDISIAADGARFKLPEMEKDLPPTLAISAMMARVPRKALTFMVYSMTEIDAHTALQLGIVSAVVPQAEARCGGGEAPRHHDRALARSAHRGQGLHALRPDHGRARRAGVGRQSPGGRAVVGGALTMSDTEASRGSPFWRFSLGFYRVPEVADTCIELQDQAGVDVNLLMFLLWNATQKRQASKADVENLERRIGEWRNAAVVPAARDPASPEDRRPR